MKVILTEKVPFLGNVGEICNVSAGHARNYLIPRKLAVVASDSSKKMLEDQKKRLNKKIQEQRSHALELKKKIDGISMELFKKVGASGKLFGAVTNADLSKELETKGILVERRLIYTEAPIKSTGQFDIKVKLFSDVEAIFQVKVSIDPKQAEELKKQQMAAEKRAKERKAQEAAKAEEAAKAAAENPEGVQEDSESAEQV